MLIGNQDHRRVTMTVPAARLSSLHQLLDLARRQILALTDIFVASPGRRTLTPHRARRNRKPNNCHCPMFVFGGAFIHLAKSAAFFA
jgi:hypothetical protein